MQRTMQYSVGGQLVDVGEDRYDEFLRDVSLDTAEMPEEVVTYDVGGEMVKVRSGRADEFLADCEADGISPVLMRSVTMDDGNMFSVRDRDLEQLVQARRQGFDVSRTMLSRLGIPEQYAKTRETRNWLAQRFGDMFYPNTETEQERLNMMGVDSVEIPGDVQNIQRVNIEQGSTALAGVRGFAQGFGEGLARSVTDPASLYEETYGDGIVKNALLGGQDFANTVVKSGMDVVSKAVGGRSTVSGRAIREAENALPTDQAEMGIGDETEDAVLGFANDFSKNTLSTIMKYAVPGVAAVDIAGSVVDNYYDAYEEAVKNGASPDKANALAAASAGIGTVEGIWLAKSAAGGKPASAVKSALKRIFGMGGKMGVMGTARDYSEQAIEGGKYGYRNDGETMKGSGWLGELKTADGNVATEYTVGVNIDGKEIAIPTLVPTLTKDEIDLMVNDIIPNHKQVPDAIMQKAVDHARKMQSEGKSVYANDGGFDHLRALKSGAKSAGDGALFEATSMAAHGIAGADDRNIARNERKRAQERAAEERADEVRSAKREAQKAAFDASMSDEAKFALDREIDSQIEAGTIPEGARDIVREKVVSKVENARSLDDPEIRDGALMLAIGELQKASRVTSPALERRQTEAKMRENERQARLADDYAANEAEQARRENERKGAEINADLDAQRAAYEKREKDIEAAFERGDGELVKKLMDEQKADMDAYDKAEEERKIREAAEEAAVKEVGQDEQKQDVKPAEQEYDQLPTRENRRSFLPEYDTWLKKNARKDSDKNWNRFIAENDLPDAWKMRDEAKDQRIQEQDFARKEIEEDVSGAIDDIRNRIIDRDAKEAERKAKQAELDEAFADYDKFIEEAENKRKKGKKSDVKTPEEIRDAMKDDAVLKRIDAAYRKAKTQEERNALMEKFKARVNELRKKHAKTDTKPQKLTQEVSKNDDGKVKIDNRVDKREPPDTTALRDEIEKAKQEKGYGEHEVKVGMTTVKFNNTKESIAFAERMLSKLEVVKDWSLKDTGSDVPSEPKPLRVAKGKKIGGFNDVSKDFFAGKREHRDDLKKPIIKGGYIYATDGRIIIRMKNDVGAKDTNSKIDVTKVYSESDNLPALETFKMDVSNENIALEQANAALPSDVEMPSVEIWRSPDGKIVMRSRDTPDDVQAVSAFVNAKSLAGHDFIGMYSPKYLSKIFKTFTKLGVKDVDVKWSGPDNALRLSGGGADVMVMPERSVDAAWADTKVRLFGGRRRMTDAERSKAIDEKVKSVLEFYKGNNPKITKAELDKIENDIRRSEENNQKLIAKHNGKLDPLYLLNDDGRVDMRRNSDRLLTDPKVIEWAKKHGRDVTDGKVTPDARRAYDEEITAKTAKQAKRWFPDMKIVTHKHGEGIERGQNVIELRDTAGRSLGFFDPSTKETHLLPGADAETVAHEIMWHGTRDFAETRAAQGDAVAKKLLDKMKDVEQHVPGNVKKKVTRLYRKSGVTSADVLFNEWGAWFTQKEGGKALEAAVATREGQRWYAKALSTVKDVYKDFLSRHGMNRVDLSKVDGMTREDFVKFLISEFSSGKTLGLMHENEVKPLSTKETPVQKVRRVVYDIVAPVRDLERDIEKKTGVKISADDSVDAELALRPGLHEAVTINQRQMVNGVKDILKKYGLSSEDLGYYMALKAATGRDAKVDAKELAKIKAEAESEVRSEWGTSRAESDVVAFEAEVNRRFNEKAAGFVSKNASHIHPNEVQKVVPEIESGSKSIEYGAARDKINEIQEDTLDTLVNAGLYARADADRLRSEEPDYVPFKSEFDPETGDFIGRDSGSLAKSTFHEAKGRKSSAGDILAHIINDNAMAHHKAIENIAREKMAKLVETHPELGTVTALGNRKISEARRGAGGDRNVLLFKRAGKTYVIELNGERGKALADAFTGDSLKELPSWMRSASRAWAATATELSPTFAVRNFSKDNIELAQNVLKEMGYVDGAKFMAHYSRNQVKSAKAVLEYVTTGKTDKSTESGRLFQQFIDDGGMIGGYGKEGYSSLSKELSSENIERELKKGSNAAKAVAGHMLNSVSYINRVAELTSRFNAYRTKLESGATRREAALWSRRTLTDFNRKGQMTGITNVARLFSNSTLGASARAASGLVTTKNGLKLTAGLMAFGAARAAIEHFLNEEDDKRNEKIGRGTGKDVSEYDRKTSLWLHRNAKDGKIVKVGAHDGPFQLMTYAGDCAFRVAAGDMSVEDAAKELGLSVAELATALSGLGSVNFDSTEGGVRGAAKAFVASIAPSVLQPEAELMTNTDYAGRKVFTEKFDNDNTPYFKRARKNTPEWSKDASEYLNSLTGGNDARAGYIDIPPEAIQKIVESFGKNMAKDVITAWETGKALFNGTLDKLDDRMVPVKRDFVRDAPDSTSRYFKAKDAFKKDADEANGRMRSMTPKERKEMISERPWISHQKKINDAISRIEALRKLEGGKVKAGKSWVERKSPASEKQVEAWKDQRLKLQAFVIEMMDRPSRKK